MDKYYTAITKTTRWFHQSICQGRKEVTAKAPISPTPVTFSVTIQLLETPLDSKVNQELT